ncbi:MAG: hypothetical protein JXA73_24515 [Acidobacteria bacterium]|nr:hypothetical protein [Acidobacteriota bacterium]
MTTTQETEFLTVAAIRKAREGNATEYLFNERQRIFKFKSMTKISEDASRQLEDAFRKERPLRALLDEERGHIQRVYAATDDEWKEFKRVRILLEKPERPRRIDVLKIDPTTFNIVDNYLRSSAFRLCTRIVPSYRSAKAIFDFCAKQSCHLPGPYDISPCIPFQYVRDGCYARAHKMRSIITARYRYCCEKVFSFANSNNDRLAVRVDKWGGCCVGWWYHVAPLIRVRVGIISPKISLVLAMVIDPGMFDKPVLLSSWLSAQKNIGCDPNANVSMYSIQPGSAYSPANYAGTAFTTDPSYTATDNTLNLYHSYVTCT